LAVQEFDAAYEAEIEQYQVTLQQWQLQNSAYMAWVGRAATVRQTGESQDDLGPIPPLPGPLPVVPTPAQFARTYYASTPVSLCQTSGYHFPFASQVANM
jgi:hypothetical protein